jgi:hypothetical protein
VSKDRSFVAFTDGEVSFGSAEHARRFGHRGSRIRGLWTPRSVFGTSRPDRRATTTTARRSRYGLSRETPTAAPWGSSTRGKRAQNAPGGCPRTTGIIPSRRVIERRISGAPGRRRVPFGARRDGGC